MPCPDPKQSRGPIWSRPNFSRTRPDATALRFKKKNKGRLESFGEDLVVMLILMLTILRKH